MSIKRKGYNTTLRVDLAKRLRILAAYTGKRQNELLEEAIEDLIEKHEPVSTGIGLFNLKTDDENGV